MDYKNTTKQSQTQLSTFPLPVLFTIHYSLFTAFTAFS